MPTARPTSTRGSQKKGWQVESVTPIKLLAKTGEIWKI